MADKPKKARRDLRARLGRTITPKTKGAGVAPPAADAPAPDEGAAEQPVVESTDTAVAAESEAAAAPASQPPAGIAAPPAGIAAPPAGIAVPPAGISNPAAGFGQAAANPFADSAPQAAAEPQVVRLEFDDALVTDQEVGRSTKYRLAIVAVLCLVVGIGGGWGLGSMMGQRALYDATVRDAQTVYQQLQESTRTMETVQNELNDIVQAASGAAGTDHTVDYDAIGRLVALQLPFEASAFTTRNYQAFGAGTVSDLFYYLMNVQKIFEEIQRLQVMTAQNHREELNRTAEAVGETANTLYGIAMKRNEGRLLGTLVFLRIEQNDGETQVLAQRRRGGRTRELQVYAGTGEEEIGSNEEYVMLVDGAASSSILAEQTGAFGRFFPFVQRLKVLVDQTMEIQGRLINAIGPIASLNTLDG